MGTGDQQPLALQTEKTESIVYIADIDVRLLPLEQQIAGIRFRSSLVQTVESLKIRYRDSEELAVYSTTIQQEALQKNYDLIIATQKERDALVFKGLSQDVYRKELLKSETALEDLRAARALLVQQAPRIEQRPALLLHKDNRDGRFLPAPEPKVRKAFCKERTIDFLLTASLREYYQRWIFTISLYRAIDDKIIYEDFVIFDPQDKETYLHHITSQLAMVLSGERPGAVLVRTEPDKAIISIDGKYAGTGQTPILEGPSGKLEVVVDAQEYFSSQFMLERRSGELVQAHVFLQPFAMESFGISSSEEPYLIYIDGIYQGTTPIDMSIPKRSSLTALHVAPNTTQDLVPFVLQPSSGTLVIPPQADLSKKQSVEKMRKQFYGAFGRFWLIMPIAFVFNGYTKSYIDTLFYYGKAERAVIDEAIAMYYTAQAFWGLTIITVVETLYRLGRYVYTANASSAPFIQPTQGTQQK
ncbi:MAG: hypothetical protein SNJ56_07070 [Termitinemataceae bacterium]